MSISCNPIVGVILIFLLGYWIGYKKGCGDWWCKICKDKKKSIA